MGYYHISVHKYTYLHTQSYITGCQVPFNVCPWTFWRKPTNTGRTGKRYTYRLEVRINPPNPGLPVSHCPVQHSTHNELVFSALYQIHKKLCQLLPLVRAESLCSNFLTVNILYSTYFTVKLSTTALNFCISFALSLISHFLGHSLKMPLISLSSSSFVILFTSTTCWTQKMARFCSVLLSPLVSTTTVPFSLVSWLKAIQQLRHVFNTESPESSRVLHNLFKSPICSVSLYWLLVSANIKYKLLLLTYKALHGFASSYLFSVFPFTHPDAYGLICETCVFT